jgi:hypothetical protein
MNDWFYLKVSLKFVSANSLGDFFAYLYIPQLTAKSQSCDSMFIVLGEKDVLISQTNFVQI